jgi:hypothetical protein
MIFFIGDSLSQVCGQEIALATQLKRAATMPSCRYDP